MSAILTVWDRRLGRGNLLVLLALAFALWRSLGRQFARIATHFLALTRETGEGKGGLKAVQTHTPDRPIFGRRGRGPVIRSNRPQVGPTVKGQEAE